MKNSKGKYGPAAIDCLPLIHQGKTRDTFPAHWPKGKERRLPPRAIVATQRISTHNVVHKSLVPYKDEVLTALTIFWLKEVFEPIGIPHHLVAYGREVYDYLPGSQSDYPDDLHLRTMITLTLNMIPVEFIFRAYLCGSLWKDFYSKHRPSPYGGVLPLGLPLMYRFESSPGGTVLFTPTDKSETDDPLDFALVSNQYPDATHLARTVFREGRTWLKKIGLEGVDSKFEVGLNERGKAVLADEVWTGDSSRIVSLADINIGKEPPWRDKQLARDEAERIWGSGPKVPLRFDPEVLKKLSTTYLELFEQITGKSLVAFQKLHMF